MITLWINIVMMILLSSLTGAIMVIFWYAIGRMLERMGFANIVFDLLKMVVAFFMLPFAFVTWKYYEADMGRGHLLSPTPYIVELCSLSLKIWSIGMIVILTYLLFDMYRVKRKCRGAFCCPQSVQAVFDELKGDLLSSRSPLQLRQCYRVETPFSVGVLHPMIVLAVERYTQEELRIILLHEMTHYRQKDLALKLVSYIMLAIHWFNPFAWILFHQIQKWSEYACDLKVSKYAGGNLAYFNVIMQVMEERPHKSGLTSQLAASQHELTERAQKLMRISKMKKKSTFSAVLTLCIAFMFSSTSVYAATMECADAYVSLEKSTAVEDMRAKNVVVTDDMTVEYGDSGRITVVEGELQQHSGRATNGFEWDVPSGYRIYTPWFDCEAGERLAVTVLVEPGNLSTRVGLEDSQGYRYYVVGMDVICTTFDITSSGEYRIYVQNNTNADFSVAGTYIIQ